MRVRVWTALGLVGASLVLAACAVGPAPAPEPVEPPALTTVPDLVGRSLSEASEVLESSHASVDVRFPGYVAQPWGFDVPERVVPLQRVADGRHRIDTQSPQPGTPVSSVSTITLVAGEHPNDTGIPWMQGHAIAVKRKSAGPCFQCHDELSCSRCHMDVLR